MKQTVLIILLLSMQAATAKQVGSELVEQHYKEGFTLLGNKATCYPAVFKYGQQNLISQFKINQD